MGLHNGSPLGAHHELLTLEHLRVWIVNGEELLFSSFKPTLKVSGNAEGFLTQDFSCPFPSTDAARPAAFLQHFVFFLFSEGVSIKGIDEINPCPFNENVQCFGVMWDNLIKVGMFSLEKNNLQRNLPEVVKVVKEIDELSKGFFLL